MGFNLKKIIDVVGDFVPLGGVAKSLVKGAGSLLFKKAAKAVGIKEEKVEEVFAEASKLAEYDHEIKKALIEEEKEKRAHELAVFGRFAELLIEEEKEKRAHELAVFGRFAELDLGSQKLRARIRPLLSFGLIGLFMLYGIVFLVQQMFPYLLGMEVLVVFPPALVKIALAVIGFWFGGRTIEKIFGKDK